jgi:hypothetical protein
MQMLSCRSTVARLVKVAAAFASPNGATIKKLSEELEVSSKTIQRDRDFLRDRIGLQIEMETIGDPWCGGQEFRWRATNAAQVLPMIETLGRFVL